MPTTTNLPKSLKHARAKYRITVFSDPNDTTMTSPEILGQLSRLHEMMRGLLESVPTADANRCFLPRVGSLTWILGRSVYRETYWLREVLTGDKDLTDRVRHIFGPGPASIDEQTTLLPPIDHLLKWAREIQDEHLRRLATPGALPDHRFLAEDRLAWYLLQESSKDYEDMLSLLLARQLDTGAEHRVQDKLSPCVPLADAVQVEQGHYRIGSRGEPFAYDNELPPQAVKLSAYRIGLHPATNAEYLAFIEAGGYQDNIFWDDAGRHWLSACAADAPVHWRRDHSGLWYGIGVSGPADLPADALVSGIGQHEARAYANWVSAIGEQTAGAVVQHEYQWEVAARGGLIQGTGRVWEWCANPFHPHPDFAPYADQQTSSERFDTGAITLRGASLHTQRCLRRASFRLTAQPEERHRYAGVRLVFPPES